VSSPELDCVQLALQLVPDIQAQLELEPQLDGNGTHE
jgi:hypothetical protein